MLNYLLDNLRLNFKVSTLVMLFGVLVAGCSSDENKEEPAELEDIEQVISVNELWSSQVGDGYDDQYLFLQPVFTSDLIYAVDVYGELVAVNKQSGKTLWDVDLDERVSGALGFDGLNLYYATYNGELVSLDINRDSSNSSEPVKEKWRSSLSSEAIAPPQSNDKIVVVQTVDGRVAAFDKKSGERLWVYQSSAPVLSLRGTATPYVTDEITITGFANGELIALDNTNGTPHWQKAVSLAQGRTELERLVDVDGSVSSMENMLYATSFQGDIKAIEAISGKELWSKSASSYVSAENDFGSVYISQSNGNVVALDRANRSESWKQASLSYRRLTAPIAVDSLIAVGDFEGYLHFLSKTDGKIVGRIRVDSDGLRAPMYVDESTLFVFGNGGVLAAYTIEN